MKIAVTLCGLGDSGKKKIYACSVEIHCSPNILNLRLTKSTGVELVEVEDRL